MGSLRNSLDEALNGVSGLLALIGDPGIGKTRLLVELESSARADGVLTLWGRASEFEQVTPFGVLVDALDGHLEAHELGVSPDSILASIFPELGTAVRTGHDYSGLERYRLYRAVLRVIEQLAEPSGLLIVFDDVHWADEGTIEFLDHVARHPPRARVLIVMAYRPKQAPPRLALNGRHIQIGPFSQEEAAEFLGPAVSHARRTALYDASGGNPFYLQALAKVEAGDLPTTLHAALRIELTDLAPSALLLAQAAAAIADEFDPALMAITAEIPLQATFEDLDELVARDLIRPADLPNGRFRFRHPLVRQAAYESASPGWRLRAHARIAGHLAEIGAPATVRAHHVERSGFFGDRESVNVLVEAARTVAATAPATAAHWLESALRLLPDDEDGRSERLDLLLELARGQTVSGRLAEGRETAYEVLRLLPDDDYARRAHAARFCHRVERLLDRPMQERAVLLSELRKMPHPHLPDAIPIRLSLVVTSLMRGDHRAAQAVLDFLPKQSADHGLAVAMAALRPMTSYAAGRIPQALDYLATADELMAATADVQMLEWMDMIAWLCWTELWLGRHRTALARFERAIGIAKATGQIFIVTTILAGLARTHGALGNLSEAMTAAEESAEVARLLHSGYAMTVAQTQRSLLAAASGDDETAVRLSAEAAQSGVGAGEWPAAQAWYAYATALATSGRIDEADDAVAAVESSFAAGVLDQFSMLSFCETMADACASGGDRKRASAWAERATFVAHPGLAFNAGIAGLAAAHALHGMEAAEKALHAVAVFEAEGQRLNAGRALLRAGRAYAEADRPRDGLPHLEAAATFFQSCGAHGLLAQCAREQRRAGKRVPVKNRIGGGLVLSTREREIALLVVEGHTNAQIAERLFLSVRTIETHLSHVYTKLGVASRIGLALAITSDQQ